MLDCSPPEELTNTTYLSKQLTVILSLVRAVWYSEWWSVVVAATLTAIILGKGMELSALCAFFFSILFCFLFFYFDHIETNIL